MTALYATDVQLDGLGLIDLERLVAQVWLGLPEGEAPALGHTQLDSSRSIVVHRSSDGSNRAFRAALERLDETGREQSTVLGLRNGAGVHVWLDGALLGPPSAMLRPPAAPLLQLVEDLLRGRADLDGVHTFSQNEDAVTVGDHRPLVLLCGEGTTTEELGDAVLARIRGMARVRTASPAGLARVFARHSDLPALVPGSILVLRQGSAPLHLPRTLVLRQPAAAAVRVQRACLDDYLARSSALEMQLALALPGMPNSAQAGAVDEDALLDETERLEAERTRALEEAARLRKRYDDLVMELAESVHESEDYQRRLRFAQRRLVALGDYGGNTSGTEDEDETDLPASCVEALERARDLLGHVRITARHDVAQDLDRYPESLVWAQKAWMAMLALEDYARLRAEGRHNTNFRSFCTDPLPGARTVNPGWVALSESESTRNSRECRLARLFAVPPEVSEERRAYMEAHIKVQKVGAPAPRMHFLDDSPRTGWVVVGYLGGHLPLAGG